MKSKNNDFKKVEIFGKRRMYNVTDLPGIFREVADELDKADPPTYSCEDVEDALEKLSRYLRLSNIRASTEI